MVAGESEVTRVIRTAMLLCSDVFNVEGRERNGCLNEAAILATTPRTLTNKVSCGGVHQG
jgi:hypothetical protein